MKKYCFVRAHFPPRTRMNCRHCKYEKQSTAFSRLRFLNVYKDTTVSIAAAITKFTDVLDFDVALSYDVHVAQH